jgi:hypothetical protein
MSRFSLLGRPGERGFWWGDREGVDASGAAARGGPGDVGEGEDVEFGCGIIPGFSFFDRRVLIVINLVCGDLFCGRS